MSSHEVDAFRFTGRLIRKIVLERIDQAPAPGKIPWTRIRQPVDQSRVALVTTAGISMRDDEPFDMEGERRNPLWGDPGWRRIDATASSSTVAVNHLHIDTSYIERDINVALPLARLAELEAEGTIGSAATAHFSIMGYQGEDASTLENVSGPEIAAAMRDDAVDLAVLAPV